MCLRSVSLRGHQLEAKSEFSAVKTVSAVVRAAVDSGVSFFDTAGSV